MPMRLSNLGASRWPGATKPTSEGLGSAVERQWNGSGTAEGPKKNVVCWKNMFLLSRSILDGYFNPVVVLDLFGINGIIY